LTLVCIYRDIEYIAVHVVSYKQVIVVCLVLIISTSWRH